MTSKERQHAQRLLSLGLPVKARTLPKYGAGEAVQILEINVCRAVVRWSYGYTTSELLVFLELTHD